MGLKLNRFGRTGPTNGEEYYVLGGGHLGASIARRLEADGHVVSLVDDSHHPDDIGGVEGDPADLTALEDAGVENASTVVVATPEDSRNLLVAQKLRARFDIPEIVVLVHRPDRRSIFEEVGHEPICATSVLSEALVDRLSPQRQEVTE